MSSSLHWSDIICRDSGARREKQVSTELIDNIEQLHTTELGVERIKKNLSLGTVDVVKWCKDRIMEPDTIIGKKRKKLVCYDTDLRVYCECL